MRHYKIIILFIISICIIDADASNIFTRTKYSLKDGISHNMVKNMLQDSNGQLWLSTWNGIDRFDGYRFENYKSYSSDRVKLGNNRTDGICLSSYNNIWGTTYDRTMFMFNTMDETFHTVFPDNQTKFVNRFFPLSDGIVWVLSENQELYRINEKYIETPDSIKYYGKANYPAIGNNIYMVYQDSDGDEWILSNRGVTIIGGKKIVSSMNFEHILEIGQMLVLATADGYITEYKNNGLVRPLQISDKINEVNKLMKLSERELAVVSGNKLFVYDTVERTTRECTASDDSNHIIYERTFVDGRKNIWVFTSDNMIGRFDTNNGELKLLDIPAPDKKQEFNSQLYFHEDNNGYIWAVTNDGTLLRYNEQKEIMELALYEKDGKYTQYSNVVRSCFSDNQKNLWLITHDGIEKLSFSKKMQERLQPEINDDARGLMEDHLGRVWVGLKNNSLELFDKTEYIGNIDKYGRIVKDRNIKLESAPYSILEDENRNIWVGTRRTGLYILEPAGKDRFNIRRYQHSPGDKYSLSDNSIYSIIKDSKGRIWIGTYGGGLNLVENTKNGGIRFINSRNKMRNYPISQCSMVRCITESRQGVMMVGSTKGLVTFSSDFESPENINFFHNYCETKRSDCLSNNDVMNIIQAPDGDIFISTFSAGIDVTSDSLNLLQNDISFRNINKKNGLTSDMSLSAVNDNNGNIWFTSISSITRYNPLKKEFENFGAEVLKTELNITESKPMIDNSGNLIIGTTKGAMRIYLDELSKSTYSPNIVFSEISIKNKDGRLSTPMLIKSSELKLKENERTISVTFAALDFSNPGNISYAYRLKGIADEWIHIGTSRTAGFANLPAGKFTLEVKATNGEGVWGEKIASLPIHVVPTFLETGYATVIYVALIILIMAVVVFIITYIVNLRRTVDMEKDFVQFILKFLTDISHELRTPLTLITTPIEEVIKNEKLTDSGIENMTIAKRNTDRMLKLVNQILDFRKIQKNKMKLRLEKVDAVGVVNQVFDSFSTTANLNLINYSHQCETDSAVIYTDVDKLEKILYNLLSNAFKFTPKGHTVTVRTSITDRYFVVNVTDDGSGFDIRKMEQLFNRFTTGSDADPSISTGIGLSLVKELVALMKGKIEVDSSPHKGSSFTIYLPKEYDVETTDAEFVASDSGENKPVTKKVTAEIVDKRLTVLVVEDNNELRKFIMGILQKEYKVIEAADGREGLEKTISEYPDLVISDVMMPNMDGIEYLDRVKNNPETSHIPVILLTAKSSVEDRIEGVRYGADDYITKPFSSDLLKIRINSIFRQRDNLRKHFLNVMKVDNIVDAGNEPLTVDESNLPQQQITDFDREFVDKMVSIIEENIDNPEFRIEIIANSMSMSRPVFYRKTKAILGLSPIDFVKRIRIRRVVELLDSNELTIAESAYKCGFTAPQYMSKIFREVTGCSPSEYLNMKNKDEFRQHFRIDISESHTKTITD